MAPEAGAQYHRDTTENSSSPDLTVNQTVRALLDLPYQGPQIEYSPGAGDEEVKVSSSSSSFSLVDQTGRSVSAPRKAPLFGA